MNSAQNPCYSFRLDSLLAGSGKAKLKVEMGDIVTIYSLNDIFGQTDETVFISGHVKKSR